MTRFVLRAEPPLRIALDALLPARLAGLSTGEIERLPLPLGNRQSRVGDWFRVEAGSTEQVVIEGPAGRFDRIGAGLEGGEIVVVGDAGACLGIGMSGGRILVEGAAAYGLATDLRGGSIRVLGRAGGGIGGALPGATSGMRGGTVIVEGAAGDRVGQRLRRGLIVVRGGVGAGCGAEMVAGTIVVGGAVGAHAGTAMRRGSLVALGAPPALGAGFVDTGVHELVILRLLARHLAAMNVADLAAPLRRLRRLSGDLAVGGRGEVMLIP